MFGRRKKDPEAVYQAALAARREGRHDDAHAGFAEAARLGHKVGLFEMGVAAERNHRKAEAREWFVRARDAGHVLAQKKVDAIDGVVAAPSAADLAPPPPEHPGQDAFDRAAELRDRGRMKDARTLLQEAHDAGHPDALEELADLLPLDDPRKDELYAAAAESGDPKALRRWGDHLMDTDRPAEALPVWERLEATRGGYWGTFFAGQALERLGRRDEALAAYTRAQEEPRLRLTAQRAYDALAGGSSRAAAAPAPARPDPERDWAPELREAWQLECRGETEAAEERYRDLALSADDPDAMAGLARLLDLRGETSEAVHWRDTAEAYGAYLERP